MTSEFANRPGRAIRTGRFQFSLRAIFIAITALAIVSGLIFVAPLTVAGPSFLFLMLAVPGILMTVAKYGSGGWPAFCIEALFRLA